MNRIEYETTRDTHIRVKLDGKFAGEIRRSRCGRGFLYQPKNSRHTGPTFNTVAEVKASLEGDD